MLCTVQSYICNFTNNNILMVEFTTEDYTLMCEQSFYSEINQEVNRRMSVILDTRRNNNMKVTMSQINLRTCRSADC